MNQYKENEMRNSAMVSDELTIDLLELLEVLWKKAHIILLCGIIAALLAFAGTSLLITPQYTSKTKVYVLSKSSGETTITSSDLQAGTYLTKDYTELVKSRTVLEQVIALLELDMKPDELINMVSVETASDSRILTIKVTNEDPKKAKEIADAVRECVSVQITEIMNAEAVNTVESADLPEEPSSPNLMKNILLGGILGVFFAMAAVVVVYLLDDTVKTSDDVETYLGLNTLALIPVRDGQTTKQKKKKKVNKAKK